MEESRALNFVIAGDTREVIERECGVLAWRRLADNGFLERTSIGCVGFCRDIDSNSLLVVLPKAFSHPHIRKRLQEPTYQREQIFRLIRVFKKIRQATKFSLSGGKTNKNLAREEKVVDQVLDSFDAALILRREFRDKGVYVRKASRQEKNKPNLSVNWPATIRRSSAVLTDREIFFDYTLHHSRKRDVTNRLFLLHVSCLKEIFSLTGERSGLESTEGLDQNEFRKLRANPRNFIRELRASTYDERGRFLIAAINSFIGESSLLSVASESVEELLSYTKDFEDIWEKVLRDLMTPVPIKRSLPPGQWHPWPSAANDKGMQPEVDIRLKSRGTEVLVDAKDYRLINGSKWKGSNGDHYKQIIYRQLLDNPIESLVVNILAFPNLGQKSLFEIKGCHYWKEIPGSAIFEVTVDYDLAIKCWLREISLDIAEELSSLVQELNSFTHKIKMPTSE